MAELTPAEEQELAALEAEEQQAQGGFSLAEEQELAMLEAEEAQAQQSINEQSMINARAPIEDELSFGESLIGGLETAATIASGALGTAAGGIAGLATSAIPTLAEGSGAAVSEGVRDALTFKPRTIGGKEILGDVGEALKPLGDLQKSAEEGIGDKVYDLTDSPTLAALAQTIPEIGLELATMGISSAVGTGVKTATREGKKILQNRQRIKEANKAKIKDIEDAAVAPIIKQEADTGIRQFTSDTFPPESRTGKFAQQQGEMFLGGKRSAQQKERVDAVQRIFDEYNVSDGARYEATIVEGITASVDAKKEAFGKAFEETTGKLAKLGNVPINNTKRFARAIRDKQMSLGTLADDALVRDMQSILDSPNNMNFDMVKTFRSTVGERLSKVKQGAPVQGNADLGMLKETYKQLTKDMEKFAKRVSPATAKEWKIADNAFSDFAIGNNKNAAKNLIKRGDATPEVVDQLLFSTKKSDHDFLNMNLGVESKAAVKQRILQRMLEKSTFDGTDMNPNKFITQAQKHRNQLGKFFSSSEKKAMNEIIDSLQKTRRAQDSAVATPTGQSVVPLAMFTAPLLLIPAAVVAIMESAPLRNLFIKMKASKGVEKHKLLIDLKTELEKLNIDIKTAPVATSTIRESQRGEN
jgi:hypothetical protein